MININYNISEIYVGTQKYVAEDVGASYVPINDFV